MAYTIKIAGERHQIIEQDGVEVASIVNRPDKGGWQAQFCKMPAYRREPYGAVVGVNRYINQPNGADLIMDALAAANSVGA